MPKGDIRSNMLGNNHGPEYTICRHKKPRSMAGLQCLILIAAMRLFYV